LGKWREKEYLAFEWVEQQEEMMSGCGEKVYFLNGYRIV
jgi:hypothetical protein